MVDDEMAKDSIKSVEQAVVADVRYGVVLVGGTVRIMVNQGLDEAARPQTKLFCLLILYSI